jgi:hypothetical protein
MERAGAGGNCGRVQKGTGAAAGHSTWLDICILYGYTVHIYIYRYLQTMIMIICTVYIYIYTYYTVYIYNLDISVYIHIIYYNMVIHIFFLCKHHMFFNVF